MLNDKAANMLLCYREGNEYSPFMKLRDRPWLWRAPVFGDFIVHGAVPRYLELEKGSKKGASNGVRTAQCTVAKIVKRLGFSQFRVFGAKAGRNPIDFRNIIGRVFQWGLP